MQISGLKKLKIPDEPGVYIFRDYKNRPIYIGRATSLRDRVRSYFRADIIKSRGPRIVDMVTKSRTVTWQALDSVLEAILLESQLIKRYQPYYNVDERDDKSSQYIVITDEEWPRVFLARARDLEQDIKDGTLSYKIKSRFGPYPEAGLIKEAMKILRRMFPFRDKKSLDSRHEAFYRSIGQSPDVTTEENRLNYIQTIKYLTLFFQGRKARLKQDLKKNLKLLIEDLEFERARELVRLINAIEHIRDISLIKREASTDTQYSRSFRMEAYDIAHLSGMENVGVMVVSNSGELAPSEYRKFKVSKDKNDDIGSLIEVMTRRLNHPEWQFPDLIVVDGNKVQVAHAESVLSSRRVNIPVVGVTKDDRHKAASIVGSPDIVKRYKVQIIALNSEAHRFAISYHRKRRSLRLRS